MTEALPETALPPSRLGARSVTRRFGPVTANDGIDFDAGRGTVHAIVGGNGAGKSTLMRILQGLDRPDEGSVTIDGRPVEFTGPADAFEYGIGMVHQEFMLVPGLTLLENLVLSSEPVDRLGQLDKPRALEAARLLERQAGVVLDWDMTVDDAPVHVRQIVEILRLLYRGADVLILDEPTAVLAPAQVRELVVLLRKLRDEGRTIIFISHKLAEVMDVADDITVIRNGRKVASLPARDASKQKLAEMMIGEVLVQPSARAGETGPAIVDIKGLTARDVAGNERLMELDLTIHAGEIVGIAGVAGNGQSELLQAIAGIRRAKAGTVILDDAPVDLSGSAGGGTLRERGLAHVPEDRHHMGLVLPFEENENSILGYQDQKVYLNGPLLDIDAIRTDARKKIEQYDIRPPDCRLKTANFSGGNQQKIVLAREMERDPVVLLVGQPTRGVDVGAIEFIHKRIIEMRDQGKAILLVSVELDEILGLADRIAVMFDGRIMGERDPEKTNERELGLLMAGVEGGQAA